MDRLFPLSSSVCFLIFVCFILIPIRRNPTRSMTEPQRVTVQHLRVLPQPCSGVPASSDWFFDVPLSVSNHVPVASQSAILRDFHTSPKRRPAPSQACPRPVCSLLCSLSLPRGTPQLLRLRRRHEDHGELAGGSPKRPNDCHR